MTHDWLESARHYLQQSAPEMAIATALIDIGESLRMIAGTHNTTPAPWPTDTSTSASPPSQAPASSGHTCQHGPMVHKTGTSKSTGKSWAAWMCPLPRERRDEQCDPVWDRG